MKTWRGLSSRVTKNPEIRSALLQVDDQLFELSHSIKQLNKGNSADTASRAVPRLAATSPQGDFLDDLFRIVDNNDPSKRLAFQIAGLTDRTTRTWTVGDYSGLPAVPPNEGGAGQLLQSFGTGNQPGWVVAPNSVYSGIATVDFGSSGKDQVTTTIATAAPITQYVVASMSYDPVGRDQDELEMDMFEVKTGNISGTTFDLLVTSLAGYVHGQYLVNYLFI